METPAELDFPAFEPHPWLRNAKAMTIAGTWRRPGQARFVKAAERCVVRSDDGSGLRVEIDRPPSPGPPGQRRGMVILHGLVGSSEAVYVLGTARKARDAGFVVARMNARNCGDTTALARGHYNGAETADLAAVARHLHEQEGVDSVHLVGFSVGANQVTRLLWRWGTEVPEWIAGVSLVSPCLDFAVPADKLPRSRFGRVVQWRFLRELGEIVRQRHRLDGGDFDITRLAQVGTVREFDDHFTAPLGGFGHANAYYREACMAGRLEFLATPTLLLHAHDDPLVPVSCLGLESARGTPVRIELTDAGGHVGWIGRRAAEGDADRYWAENRVVQFARACLPG